MSIRVLLYTLCIVKNSSGGSDKQGRVHAEATTTPPLLSSSQFLLLTLSPHLENFIFVRLKRVEFQLEIAQVPQGNCLQGG